MDTEQIHICERCEAGEDVVPEAESLEDLVDHRAYRITRQTPAEFPPTEVVVARQSLWNAIHGHRCALRELAALDDPMDDDVLFVRGLLARDLEGHGVPQKCANCIALTCFRDFDPLNDDDE